jgi:hypothetical protein
MCLRVRVACGRVAGGRDPGSGIRERQQQIPLGNDRKKGKGNGKNNRRSFGFAQDDSIFLI